MYTLVQAPYEKGILERAYKEGRPIPEAMKNAPDLLPGNQFYYRAFLRLHTGRRVGFGEAAISWAEIEDYGLRLGLTESEREDLEAVISVVDKAYLDWRKEDTKKKQADAKALRDAQANNNRNKGAR